MAHKEQSAYFLHITLVAQEDFHVGSGVGGGDVDALVQIDRDGLPVIRWSHFKGLLRDTADDLLRFASGDINCERFNELLGKTATTTGQLKMTSFYLTNREKTIGGSNTLVWGSSSRVEGRRQPADDTLNFREYVCAGTEFKAIARVRDEDNLNALILLLRRIDAVGSRRNRGSGLIKLSWKKEAIPADGLTLRLMLKNLEPLCLPATGSPGNLIHSQSFIRGRTLKGALAGWLYENDLADAEMFAVLERTIVNDALPLPASYKNVARVLPIPLSVMNVKPVAGNTQLPWWAMPTAQHQHADELGKSLQQYLDSGEKRKRPKPHEYICQAKEGDTWLRFSPELSVRMRNDVSNRELFTQEEIAENTYFQLELTFASKEDRRLLTKQLSQLLSGMDWLGLGRGRIPVQVTSYECSDEQSCCTYEKGEDAWTLTLLSDAVVRGPYLGFVEDLSIECLCDLANIEKQDGWHIVDRYVATESVHGFNGISGLQRPPVLALRRGSCWQVKGEGVGKLALALSELKMLGEYTNEGFGKFAIGLQPLELSDDTNRSLAEVPYNSLQEMHIKAKELAEKIKKHKISRSQLQWFSSACIASVDDKGLSAVLSEVESAPIRRPKGGSAWKGFPMTSLRKDLDDIETLAQKRLFIQLLIQWSLLDSKEVGWIQ